MDLVKFNLHHGAKDKTKNTKEPTIIPINKHGLWKPKMKENMLEEELMSGFLCNNIITRFQNSDPNDAKTTTEKHLFPRLVEGKNNIKSKGTNSQGLSRAGKRLQIVWMSIYFGII